MECLSRNKKPGLDKQHHVELKRASGRNMWYQHKNYIHSRRPLFYSTSSALLTLVVLLITFLGTASAQKTHDRHIPRPRSSEPLHAVPVEDLAPWKGSSLLVVDTRPQPVAPHLMLFRRRGADATKTTSASVSKTTSASVSKKSIDTDPSAVPSDFQIPKPFDTALSSNFTASCSSFFQSFLTDQEFNTCHPFSLMLQTSSAFFDASKSFIRITQTLEATCKSSLTSCRNVMNGKAQALISKNNCGVDYSNDNPQVLQAYNGLLAYEPLYQASCLRDDQGSYCYANAVTNTSATTDSYPYFLPLGVSLPGGARPTCNSCLQNAMAIFSSFADNSTQPISKTYNAAAQQIDLACGPTFVNKTAIPLKGSASANTATLAPTITLFMTLIYFFL